MNRTSSERSIHFAVIVATCAAIAWGALAFGAVYTWAYVPLLAVCVLVGAAGLVLEWHGRPPARALASGLVAIGIAISLQLIPLPLNLLARISPNTDAFLRQYDLSYGASTSIDPDEVVAAGNRPSATHALSIAPDQTLRGLALFSGFAVLVLGLPRVLSRTGASPIVRFVVGFGLALAVIGIFERARTATMEYPVIYGFWLPRGRSRPFGPFVNPNHFAGWMVMGLPLALAAFYDALLRMLGETPPYGNRRSIVRSPSFGSTLMIGFASIVMGLSLFMTKARSGIGAFALGSVLAGWTVFRRQQSRPAKAAVVVSFLLLLAGTMAWAGVDTIAGKFVSADALESTGFRLGIWKDTLGIIRRFPLAGTGFDTYGVATNIYQTNRVLHFQEAHNDYLQLVAEGGLLVSIPILITLAIFFRDVRRRFREAPKGGTTYWLRVGAVVGLVSIALQSFVEFSLQMPGNAALFVVLAAIALHQSPNLRTAPGR